MGTKDESSGPPIQKLQDDEKFIDEHFSQHVLDDLAWEQLAQYYVAKSRPVDQLRMLQKRRNFHEKAYPGLSGAHAWVLEALGDCLMQVAQQKDEKNAAARKQEALTHF